MSSNHASLCQSLTWRDEYTISLGYFLFPFAAIYGHQVWEKCQGGEISLKMLFSDGVSFGGMVSMKFKWCLCHFNCRQYFIQKMTLSIC